MRRIALALVALLAAVVPAAAQSTTFVIPPGSLMPPVILFPASGVSGSGVVTAPQLLCPDGTALLPSCGAFASEPTLGFWRSGAGTITATGALVGTSFVGSSNILAGTSSILGMTGKFQLKAPADGNINAMNAGATLGVDLKVDALPTVASGFGGTPSITAGSTPFAGSVNVGTGGAATSGIINFNGTAFPSAPFCVANDSTTTLAQRAIGSTTQLTITSAAWTASDIVTWICVSSK